MPAKSHKSLLVLVIASLIASGTAWGMIGLGDYFKPGATARMILLAAFFILPVVAGTALIIGAVRRRRGASASRLLRLANWMALAWGIVVILSPLAPLAPALLRALFQGDVPLEELQKRRDAETTRAQAADVTLNVAPVPIEEIQKQLQECATAPENTTSARMQHCAVMIKTAGYEPMMLGGPADQGDVFAIKRGRRTEYVVIGAHYDKADPPSQGILDNMLGCVLVADVAQAFRDHAAEYTYVFVFYGREEQGRTIPPRNPEPNSHPEARPEFIIEVDYVGDKRGGLGGRYLAPVLRYRQSGIKLTSNPSPNNPPTIHTERDTLESVDFPQAYLAYKTMLWLVEGIEAGRGLQPPPTVNFWRKDAPPKPY